VEGELKPHLLKQPASISPIKNGENGCFPAILPVLRSDVEYL